MGAFVIQGGPEVELGAPVDKKHVSITHNALSVGAKVVWKRGSAGRAVGGDESLKVAEFWRRAIAGVEKAFQAYKTQAHTYAHAHTHTRARPYGE